MNRRRIFLFFIIGGIAWSLVSTSALASNWRSAAGAFDFQFNNHMDYHQQSKLLPNGNLSGFLYITYTGEYDEAGIPIAEHCNKDTAEADCVPGWRMKGEPGMAKMLYHNGDHPVWLIDNRADIPQPGAYTLFHWASQSMSMDKSSEHSQGGECVAESAMELIPGVMCHGYFIELRAIKSFVFKHHKDKVAITRGIDIATHVNIVTSTPKMGHGDDNSDGGHSTDDSGDSGDSNDHTH